MCCAGYLVNTQDYDFVINLPPVNNGHIQVCNLHDEKPVHITLSTNISSTGVIPVYDLRIFVR